MRGTKESSPLAGAKNITSAAEKAPSREEVAAKVEPRGAKQVGQHDQQDAETDSEPEVEEVCGYPVHPAAAAFPRYTDAELRVLADDIAKHGQRQAIVQHPNGSILDGLNRLLACQMAGREAGIIKWDGKPGEEVAYVISQNLARRHLNESQRAIIATKLAALPSGQRQVGKFAGVPTQAKAAEMMQVGERSVRTARMVQEQAPANLTRLVEGKRISLNAVKTLLPKLSTDEKQRIEGMSDDDAEAEVKRLNKESASTRRKEATDSQTNKDDSVAAPNTNTPNNDDDDDENRPIGAEAVSRALERTKTNPDTPQRQAFVSAIERLSRSDSAWACEVASCVEQETREREKAVPADTARDAHSRNDKPA